MKQFNLYWSTGRLSSGSPHRGDNVIGGLFGDAVTEEDATAIDALAVGAKHVDADGDTWERIA